MIPYDTPQKTAIAYGTNEITVFEVSDRDLLNEAFRRGLISRFETKTRIDPMMLEYHSEMMDSIIRSMLNDVAAQAAEKQNTKRFIDLQGIERIRNAAAQRYFLTEEDCSLTGQIYICSHPNYLSKTRR